MNKEDIEWLRITEGICKSVPVMYNENRVGSNAITDRVPVHSGKLKKNLEKVQWMGVEDAKFVSFEEAGVNLGRLAHIWEMGYLSGRKV